ncbi:hypothetical protein BKA65DRAFT_482611 [Rhexocercosporidium sp. MPI-PUGE-AT-0058]|nr:hypothetical protein BKA65DRAFT_482611 [Rhexocercosporidium sp. MPI-PUGE-AT-0058]
MADGITYGKALSTNLSDLAANSPDPNPSVDDFKIDIKMSSPNDPFARPVTSDAYGTLYTKILARWQGGGGVGSIGYYVQRNSDNLAMYALAKYVMTKNGNMYPHLPIVTYKPDGPPYPPIPGALATFVTEGGDFYWNTTGGLTAWDTDPNTTPHQEYRGCPEAENGSGLNYPLTINAFAPDSAYPDSYNAQVSTWMKALGVGSNPDSGANAGQQIAIASYTNPLGDPAAWQRLISYDSSKLSILVANVLNSPDYVVDPSWSSVIQQAASSGKTVISYIRTGYLRYIVYRVDQDKIAEVVALSATRVMGYLEVTDDDNLNPYDNVPSDSYIKAAMSAVPGGQGSYVAGLPSDAKVIASDYTSATITWSPVANALGYAVYQNGALVLEMPGSLTRAKIGILKPGTSSISFEVKTALSSRGGGASKSISASTKKPPSGNLISNVSYKKSGNTVIYTADVLVPYAFVRLFIGGPHKPIGASVGWSIDAGLSTENGGGDAVA